MKRVVFTALLSAVAFAAADPAKPIDLERFTFGEGIPTIRCAPLRITSIELQPGEKITADSAVLGDSVRWLPLPIISGTAPNEVVLITIKPKLADIDTNMIITTNKRAYYLRLVSRADTYVARVVFDYPEEVAAAGWKKVAETQALEKASEAPPFERHQPGGCAYEIKAKKGAEGIKPVRVCDQDGKVTIKMPEGLRDREAPVLMVRGVSGKDEVTNYRPAGDSYVVDRLFDRAFLVLGVGKNQQRVEIVKQKGA